MGQERGYRVGENNRLMSFQHHVGRNIAFKLNTAAVEYSIMANQPASSRFFVQVSVARDVECWTDFTWYAILP